MSKEYTDAVDLGGKVITALNGAVKNSPRPGWRRGTEESDSELLSQIDRLKEENKKLLSEKEILGNFDFKELDSDFEKKDFTIKVAYKVSAKGQEKELLQV